MNNEQNKKIGNRIHNARKQKKMSMKKLGQLVGLHESTISRYEKGEIISLDIEKMKEFARALEVNAAWLMGWDDDNLKLGEQIRKMRIQKNLTIMEMANELDISADDLHSYETGARKIPFEMLKKISEYLGVEIGHNEGLNYTKKDDESTIQATSRILKITKRWNEEVGETHFSDEEMDKLISYAKFLISQRKE